MARKGSVALLDVNVLVALFDADHVHHELAHDWFEDQREHGWATCPLTENGFVRVVSNPAYGLEGFRPDAAVRRLRAFRASGHHVFWPDSVSLADGRLFNTPSASCRQIADIYLLGLAVSQGGCLATFDRAIPLRAVKPATAGSLQVIGSPG